MGGFLGRHDLSQAQKDAKRSAKRTRAIARHEAALRAEGAATERRTTLLRVAAELREAGAAQREQDARDALMLMAAKYESEVR